MATYYNLLKKYEDIYNQICKYIKIIFHDDR